MTNLNYQLLKQILKFDIAINWLKNDVNDDFYADPVNFADLKMYPSEFLTQREHRILQTDTISYWKESVIKKSRLLREAIWLHPIHRLLYLSILRHLIARLDTKLLSEVYSYRLDESEDIDAYPFSRRMERWKQFNNDFREAALDSSTEAIVMTDLVSFYDHINCDQLCMRIRSILGTSITTEDEEVLNLLRRLLNMWSNDGYGIPQNYDPSSFFSNMYLHNIDYEMVKRRYRYFRWADDIRIVARSEKQAMRAIHELQNALMNYRLFLATEKTHIILKDDPRFAALLDVEDDQIISDAEEIIASGNGSKIRNIIDSLFERLEYHSGPNGDDRKFRAFANRLLNAADYVEIKEDICPKLPNFVIPRLLSHPERSDYWMKILSVAPNDDTVNITKKLLVDDPTIFDWQRFYLWKLALYFPNPFPKILLDRAIASSGDDPSDAVAAQAIIFVGKFGDNTQRETLFSTYFTSSKSYLIQRAVLIAIQELPEDQRNYLYKRALEINSDHKELVEYIANLTSLNYGEKIRTQRHCAEEPREIKVRIRRGVGLVKGKIVRFRLSRRDYDYE